MVRIFLDGAEIQFKDWSMRIGENKELLLQVIYPSGKKFTRPFGEWQVEPTVERCERFLYDRQKDIYQEISSALEIGEKYYLIAYPSNKKLYLYGCDKIELCMNANILYEKFKYFRDIAEYRKNEEKDKEGKNNGESICKQFDTITPAKGTALKAYLTKELQICQAPDDLIYPFGINETQMNAVKGAFSSQISIIEGPPGTGKTQTILNILCNIIINNKTCAIVSNNNAAVENVYEKLEKENLDFLVAKLEILTIRTLFFIRLSTINQT